MKKSRNRRRISVEFMCKDLVRTRSELVCRRAGPRLACLVPRLDELSSQLGLALGHGGSPLLEGVAETLAPVTGEVERALAHRAGREALGRAAGPAHDPDADGGAQADAEQRPEGPLHRGAPFIGASAHAVSCWRSEEHTSELQ